jgi:hypothetical protein
MLDKAYEAENLADRLFLTRFKINAMDFKKESIY